MTLPASSMSASAAARLRRDESDGVLLELVRLATSDDWSGARSARALLAEGHSYPALQLALTRVQRVRTRNAGRIADRAAATLVITLAMHELAMGSDGGSGLAGIDEPASPANGWNR